MVVITKKKSAICNPRPEMIRHRTALIRREWSAREHAERYQLANLFQRLLVVELAGFAAKN